MYSPGHVDFADNLTKFLEKRFAAYGVSSFGRASEGSKRI
jgi:hypothetical protein